MDALPWPNIGIGSGWLFVGLFVWLVFTGRLVPKSTHERELERSEHDANEWRAESRIKDQQITEKDTQLRIVVELSEMMKTVLGAVQARHKRAVRADSEES